MHTLPQAISRRHVNNLLRFTLSDGTSVVVPDREAPHDAAELTRELFDATPAVRFVSDGVELEGRDAGAFADALLRIADGPQGGRRWCVAMAWSNDLVMGDLAFRGAN